MTASTPPIAYFTRRLAECPSEFTSVPSDEEALEALTRAVLYDLMSDLDPEATLKEVATALHLSERERGVRRENSRRLFLVMAWLLHDPFFHRMSVSAVEVRRLVQQRMEPISRIVPADQFYRDADRREELCRIVLDHLGLVPEGEDEAFAADRLDALDSVERARVVAEAQEKARRAEEIRQRMAAEAAREAAAHYHREY